MVRARAKTSHTIGGLAKAAGVGVETVRYYQRRGLLPEPARPPGEVRRYGEEDARRLRFIRSAQASIRSQTWTRSAGATTASPPR